MLGRQEQVHAVLSDCFVQDLFEFLFFRGFIGLCKDQPRSATLFNA
jgi:hypothetical protein